jgi:hypothetical protein
MTIDINLNKKINDIIDNNYVKGTATKYKSAVNSFSKHTNLKFEDAINNIDNINFFAYEKNNKGIRNISTNYNYINHVKCVVDKCILCNYNFIDPDIKTYLDEVNDKLKNERNDNPTIQIPKTNNTLEDIYELLTKFDNEPLKLLYLQCNLFIPCRRLEDWKYAVFVEKLPINPDIKLNYVVVGDEYVRLYFNRYKEQVHKVLGVWDKTLKNDNFEYIRFLTNTKLDPEKLGLLLKNSYFNNKREYLFGYPDDNKFNIFSNSIFGLCKEPTTQNIVRHLFITNFKDNYKLNQQTQLKIAIDMGQSNINIQAQYELIPENGALKNNKVSFDLDSKLDQTQLQLQNIIDDSDIKLIELLKETELITLKKNKAIQCLKLYNELKNI